MTLDYIYKLAKNAYNLAVLALNRVAQLEQKLEKNIAKAIATAISYADSKISEIRGWAKKEISSIRAWVSGLINDVQHYVNKAIGTVEKYAYALYQQAREYVITKFKEAYSYAKSVYYAALDYADKLIAPISKWLGAWGKRLEAIWKYVTNEIAYLYDRLKALADWVTSLNLQRLFDSIANHYPFVQQILSDPIGWLVAYWSTYLLTWLEFAIAYALGTVEATLPDPPDFSEGYGGPDTPGEPGTGLVELGLHAPLSTLRVSGYRFGPGHPGIDLGAYMGQPVYAMHDGQVDQVHYYETGYGHHVVISGSQWWTRYAHLAEIFVREGDRVFGGQNIGGADSTGNSTGAHLHLEIKRHGVYVDPLPILFG